MVETLFIGLYVKMSQNAQMRHPPVGSTPIKVVKKLETAEKYLVAEICFQLSQQIQFFNLNVCMFFFTNVSKGKQISNRGSDNYIGKFCCFFF